MVIFFCVSSVCLGGKGTFSATSILSFGVQNEPRKKKMFVRPVRTAEDILDDNLYDLKSLDAAVRGYSERETGSGRSSGSGSGSGRGNDSSSGGGRSSGRESGIIHGGSSDSGSNTNVRRKQNANVRDISGGEGVVDRGGWVGNNPYTGDSVRDSIRESVGESVRGSVRESGSGSG